MRSICDFSDRKTEFLIPQKRRDQHQYYLLLTWNSLPWKKFRLSFKILLWFIAKTYKKCTEQVFLLILRVYESLSNWKRKVMLVLSWLTGLTKKHQSGIVEYFDNISFQSTNLLNTSFSLFIDDVIMRKLILVLRWTNHLIVFTMLFLWVEKDESFQKWMKKSIENSRLFKTNVYAWYSIRKL